MTLINQDVRRGTYQTGPKYHHHNYRHAQPSYRWLYVALPLLFLFALGSAYVARGYSSAGVNIQGGASPVDMQEGRCSPDVRPRWRDHNSRRDPSMYRGWAVPLPTQHIDIL